MSDDKYPSISTSKEDFLDKDMGSQRQQQQQPELEDKGAHENEKKVVFLESPEVLWQEPPTEQVLCYIGNVRNYNFYGAGLEMLDQDLFACLTAAGGISLQGDSEDESVGCELDDGARIVEFKCRRVGGCTCGSLLSSSSSSSSSSSVLYDSLPSDDHIRLLEIRPGTGNSIVECLLHIGLLPDDNYTYEALSYTWDLHSLPARGEKASAQIRCNGLNINVGVNLASALGRIRNEVSSRLVWADALCINQLDTNERNHHVMRMNLIYENARRVIIWLGNHPEIPNEPTPHLRQSHQAFAGVCEIVNAWRAIMGNKNVVPPAKYLPVVARPHSESSSPPEVLSSESSVWHTIFALYQCRWFSRLWPIQEVALARTAIVIWDECEISWEWIGLAAAIIRTNYDRISPIIRGGYRTWSSESPSRRVPSGISNAYFLYRLSRSQSYSTPLQFTFAELLKLTRQFGCKDHRDRVYGLLGLPTIDNIRKAIVPDYTKTVDEVYISIARTIIESSSSLALLSSVQRDSNNLLMKPWNPLEKHFKKNMPSWVPQWGFLLTQTISPAHPSIHFAALPGHTVAQFHPSQNPLQLIVRGILVDTVSNCQYMGFSDFWRGANAADRRAGSPWQPPSAAHDSISVHKALEQCKHTRKQLEKIALTLTAGHNWYGVPVQDVSAHLADYARCLVKDGLVWSLVEYQPQQAIKNKSKNKNKIQAEHSECISTSTSTSIGPGTEEYVSYDELLEISKTGNADRFLDAAATATKRRARFITKSDMVGIGPEAMNVNDIICVLHGAVVPFVIRPTRKGYILVGECYVHDLMHGEAVKQISVGNMADRKLKEDWIKLV